MDGSGACPPSLYFPCKGRSCKEMGDLIGNGERSLRNSAFFHNFRGCHPYCQRERGRTEKYCRRRLVSEKSPVIRSFLKSKSFKTL